MKPKKRYFTVLITLVLSISFIAIGGANLMAHHGYEFKLFHSSCNIPHNRVSLLFENPKTLPDINQNHDYTHQIAAAAYLLNDCKIDYTQMSGVNSTSDSEEPASIKNVLIGRGSLSIRIVKEDISIRTLDSILRCRLIFGQERTNIASPCFQWERASSFVIHSGIHAAANNGHGISVCGWFKTRESNNCTRVTAIMDIASMTTPLI